MTHSVTVRPARTDDLPILAEFGAALAAQHGAYDPRRFQVPSVQEFSSFFGAELVNADAITLIAEEEERIVGYAFLRVEPPSIVDLAEETMWLHDLYVQPAARGRGAGRALLQRVVDLARQRGRTRLLLKVSPSNAAAGRMFEKIGFRTTMLEMQLDL